ncbi:hypothetical protein F5B20DRAFT_544490 [Whalleya microplaca]|nr:hypothetical protein F5B20DRAFT_544490 [Whalleya microplaca]
MASPHLAIARVSFSAVLLRPDPTACSRGEIDEFLSLLDATIARCSPPNVQKCKQWILNTLVQSPARVAALGKYLTALANSFSVDIAASRQAREPSSKRKRLHILYILSDVLYHVHVRSQDPSFAAKVELFIPGLVQAAAAFANCPKHSKKVLDLVDIWDKKGYFSTAFIDKLRTTAREAPNAQDANSQANGSADRALAAAAAKSSKHAPFIMPAMHGDVTVPWYDLPAANWLSAIEPNSTRPMNPDMIKPLQLTPGPADKNLVKAVQALLADVDRLYAKDFQVADDPAADIDQLGQRVVLDEITGEVVHGETYYGWSRAFCEKRKQLWKKGDPSGHDRRGRSISRSHSPSSSRSSSRPAYKRRRMSSSRSSSRGRSQGRRRSYSRERRRRRSYSNSSRSSSRSRSRRRYDRSPSGSRDRDPRFSRPSNPDFHQGNGKPPLPPLPPGAYPHQGAPPNHPPHNQYPPAPFPQSFPPPPNFNQFPVPPPPPPNYQGQWPPPPPPPGMGGAPPNWLPAGGWAPPPPPPPPQSQGGGGYQSYGRVGRGEYRGQGHRGGWNRGRGW